MHKGIDKKRAISFKKKALLYEKMRPGYPKAWISDLRKVTKIDSSSKILEVGSGTGKATSDLVKISKNITCLDPGKEMLEIARRKFPNLTFVNSAFEDFDSPELYDLIISAMAWHWIDPEAGYKKAASLLTDAGFLSIIRYYHIDPDPEAFHNRAQHIYEQYNGLTTTKRHTEQIKRIDDDKEALNNKYFRLLNAIKYKWVANYSIEEYLALRNTYSDHITMNPVLREKMERQLVEFARKEFDGKVTKKYTTVLFIAQKTN